MSKESYDQNHKYDVNHHAPPSSKKDLFPVVKGDHGYHPASEGIKLPPVSLFSGWTRLKSNSSISNNLITSSQGQIEFDLRYNGKAFEHYMEIELAENGTGDSTLNIYNLIDYIELLSPDDGTVLQTIYDYYMLLGDNLFMSQEQLKKRARILGFDETTFLPVANTIPQSGTRTFYLPIPLFRSSPVELRHFCRPLILRIYTKSAANAVNSGTSSDLTLNSWDIIVKQLPLPLKRPTVDVKHRYVHYQRVIETTTFNANTYTDVRLTSLHGQSAYLMFFIRPQSVVNENFTAFQKIDKFELRDPQNNIISAIQHTDQFQDILRDEADGELLNLAAYDNVYFLSFCLDPQSVYHRGASNGSMNFLSDELLRVYLPAGWVNGQYRIDIISAELNTMCIGPNSIKSTK